MVPPRVFADVARLGWKRSATEPELMETADTEDWPLETDDLATEFFEVLGEAVDGLSSVDGDRVLDAVDTPVDGLLDLVGQFDDALAAEAASVDRLDRRFGTVSALASVYQALADAEDPLDPTADATGEAPDPATLQAGAAEMATLLESALGGSGAGTDPPVERHRQTGEEQFEAGAVEDAADAFRNVLLFRPEDAAAHAGFGAAMARSSRLFTIETAFRHLERALELDPTNRRANRHYAELRWEEDGEAAGREAFERAIERAPAAEQIYRAYTTRLRQAGDPEAAADVYERGLAAVDDDHDLRRYYAKFLAERGKWDRAEEQFERVVGDDRTDPLAFIWFGGFYDQRGMPDLARPYLESGFEQVAAGLGSTSLDTLLPSLVRLVELLDQAGEDDAVVRWCEFGLEHRARITDNRDALDALERMLEASREPETQAVEVDEPASSGDGGDEPASSGDKPAESAPSGDEGTDPSLERQAVAAVDTDSGDVTDPDTLADLGDMYLKTDVPEIASVYYERALDVAPDHADAHFGLAALADTGDSTDEETARHHFERAVESAPDSIRIRRRYADKLASWDDREAARRQFEAALDIDPDDALAHCWYGSHCYSWDAHDDARRHLEAGLAADRDSDEISAYTKLGWVRKLVDVCEQDGDVEAVREWCRHGLSLCDFEALPPGTDEQEAIEETLAKYADSVPTPWNRREDSKHDRYWMLNLHGQEANAIVSVNGEELFASSNGTSFATSLPLNVFLDDASYDVEITVLRAVLEDAYEEETPSVTGPAEATVEATLKDYDTDAIVSTHDTDGVATVTCDPQPTETLPTTVELSADRETQQ